MQPLGGQENRFWADLAHICHDLSNRPTRAPQTSNDNELNEQSPHIDLTPDPSKYRSDLRQALQKAESAFLPGGEIDQCISAFDDASSNLASIETALDSIISSLEHPHSSVLESTAEIALLRDQLAALTAADDHITAFAEQVEVPEHLQVTIQTANPHSSEFETALTTLSTKLAITHVDANSNSRACNDIKDALQSMRTDALMRIQQRLNLSLQLLRDPSSSFDILRDTLLRKQRHLIEFATDHDHSMARNLSREYVVIASKAIISEINSYCSLFSSRLERELGRQSSLTSLARGTTGMFSAMLSETFAVTNPNDATQSQRRDSVMPSTSLRDNAKSGCKPVIGVVRRCREALRRVSKPAVSEAEILLQRQDFCPLLEEVLHNCTMRFLESVEKERSFLRETFGDGATHLLGSVFKDCQSPVLALLKTKIENARMQRDALHSLITLFVIRAHRTKLLLPDQLIDPRITYLVETEKVVQTHLLEELDTRLDAVKHIPDFTARAGPKDEHCAQWVVDQALFVRDFLAISAMSCHEVDARDIFDTVQRRLLSFLRELAREIESFLSHVNDSGSRGRARLRSSAALLTMLEIPKGPEVDQQAYHTLRKPVLALFERTSIEYAEYVVSRNARELTQVENNIDLQPLRATRAELDSFRLGLGKRFDAIVRAYKFLGGEDVDENLCHAARRTAFTVLSDKNDTVAVLVREHWPDEAHLVVSKSALTHAMLACD